MKKILFTIITAAIILTACAGSTPPPIETVEEKIGNLTIQAPVGWEKTIDDSYDFWTCYTYMKSSKDNTGIALLSVYIDKEVQESVSISDLDYQFEDDNDMVQIHFNDINDNFLGDKPIRIGHGTWQTNYQGNIGPLFDLTKVSMFDADLRGITVEYMYLDEVADQGYSDYANKLVDTMQLIYDYQYTTS